jgi:HlyD family secretion protein
LDTITLLSQLAEANSNILEAQQRLAVSKANIVKQKSEIQLAGVEVARAQKLVQQGAGSQRELDVRRTKVETTNANLAETEATLKTAEQRSRLRGRPPLRSRRASTTQRSSLR